PGSMPARPAPGRPRCATAACRAATSSWPPARWGWIAGPWAGSMPAPRRGSSSPALMSKSTSSATWDMDSQAAAIRGFRGWNSTRLVSSAEGDIRPFTSLAPLAPDRQLFAWSISHRDMTILERQLRQIQAGGARSVAIDDLGAALRECGAEVVLGFYAQQPQRCRVDAMQGIESRVVGRHHALGDNHAQRRQALDAQHRARAAASLHPGLHRTAIQEYAIGEAFHGGAHRYAGAKLRAVAAAQRRFDLLAHAGLPRGLHRGRVGEAGEQRGHLRLRVHDGAKQAGRVAAAARQRIVA